MRYSALWRFRVTLSIDWSAWAAGATDVTVTIPVDFAWFWATVSSTGYDVRFAAADGVTLLAYNRGTWDYTNNSGVFRVANLTPSQACQGVIHMYWGNAVAADGSTAAAANPLYTGRICTIKPTSPLATIAPERPGAQRPTHALPYSTSAFRFIFMDLSQVLAKKPSKTNGANWGEELSELTVTVRDTADALVAGGPVSNADIRIFQGADFRGSIVGIKVDGSKLTDNTNYAIRLLVKTALDSANTQVSEHRCTIAVQNVRPRS